MKIRLKENRVFRTTVDGDDIKVGAEPVEVTEQAGKYLLESFPDILEKVKEGK